MPDAAKVIRLLAALTVSAMFGLGAVRLSAEPPAAHTKMDPLARQRSSSAAGHSRVIIRIAPRAQEAAAKAIVEQLGGTSGRSLPIINGFVASLPDAALAALAASPLIDHVSVDRDVVGTLDRTSAAMTSLTRPRP